MPRKALEGVWLNGWIREMLEEKWGAEGSQNGHANGVVMNGKIANGEAANGHGAMNGTGYANGSSGVSEANGRHGPTSRELSGEMGGDTSSA
jgi:hypothetical protein